MPHDRVPGSQRDKDWRESVDLETLRQAAAQDLAVMLQPPKPQEPVMHTEGRDGN